VAEVARRQHGLISAAQMQDLGMSQGTVGHRAQLGSLHRVHQGVYAVGHSLLSREARFMAAVLACGPGACLSHRSAAELWGIREDRREAVDVTAANRRGRAPKGVAAHRDRMLAPADRAERFGIPCTGVAKTLLDLAGVVPLGQLRRSIAEAEVLRLLDHRALRALMRRNRGRRGVARLRLLLDEVHPATARTRSELERLFLRMCSRASIPEPEVNVLLNAGGRQYRPDFLWRDAGLIVEADSRRFHDTDSAFSSDRQREQRLQLAGWRVTRCTWEQVEREPKVLADVIRALLDPCRRDENLNPT
jgi:predicted transcriptional regulator of viral defense system